MNGKLLRGDIKLREMIAKLTSLGSRHFARSGEKYQNKLEIAVLPKVAQVYGNLFSSHSNFSNSRCIKSI